MNERVQLLRKSIGNTIWQERYPIIKMLNGSTLEVNEGVVKFEFLVDRDLVNPNGILHGGIMATMLDELMGCAVWTMNIPAPFATINLQVDYLTAAKIGEKIIGEGIVLKAGRTVMHAEAKLYNDKNNIVAKAVSNLVVMPQKK